MLISQTGISQHLTLQQPPESGIANTPHAKLLRLNEFAFKPELVEQYQKDALTIVQEARLGLSGILETPVLEGTCLLIEGACFYNSGLCYKAYRTLEQALILLTKPDLLRVYALIYTGRVQTVLRMYLAAYENLKAAEELAENLGEEGGAELARIMQVSLHTELGTHAQANELLEKIKANLNFVPPAIQNYFALESAYLFLRSLPAKPLPTQNLNINYLLSLQQMMKAVVQKAQSDRNLVLWARSLNILGHLHLHLEQNSAAEENFYMLVDISNDLSHAFLLGCAQFGLANAFYQQGAFSIALDYFTEAHEQCKKLENIPFFSVNTLQGIALSWEKLNNTNRALEYQKLYFLADKEYFLHQIKQQLQMAAHGYQFRAQNKDTDKLLTPTRELPRKNANAALIETLKTDAPLDPLTGLATRRLLDKKLTEWLKASSTNNLLAIHADIDNFKEINQLQSSKLGDKVLQEVAGLLRRYLRPHDLAVREAGDEFLIVCRNIKAENAFGICERLRMAVQSHNWSSYHPSLRVTISIGYTLIVAWDFQKNNMTTPNDCFRKADEQLFLAKHFGRNRVLPTASVNVS